MITSVLCIISFFCGLLVYRKGLCDGQRTKNGAKIKPIINKVKKPNEAEQKIARGINNIINYSNRKSKEMNSNEQIN